MRVPVGAFTLMTNWPASVRGKKETPMKGYSRKHRQKNIRKPTTTVHRIFERLADPFFVKIQHDFEFRVEPGVESRPPGLFRLPPRLPRDRGWPSGNWRRTGARPSPRRSTKRTARAPRQAPARRTNTADAKQERDRKKNHHRDQHDGQNRQRDFVGPLDGRDRRILAHFQMAVNVFNHHHGVIDQPRKRQRQTAEHHGIDRFVGAVQNEKCDEYRNRNR